MKKLLVLLALLPVAPAIAQATIPTPAIQPMFAPGIDVGSMPTGGLPPIDCANTLDTLVSGLQSGKGIAGVNSTLMVDAQALAESPVLGGGGGGGGGFNPVGGDAHLSAGKVVGTSHVAAPGGNTRNDLGFTISKVSGKARLAWTHKGKSYASSVDSCSNGYWTAATTSSAIVVKLGPLQSAPQ